MDNNLFSRRRTNFPVVTKMLLLAIYRAQKYVLICRDCPRQRQGRSLWAINACMKVARRVLSPGKGIMFTCRKIVASSAETSSLGAKSFRAAQQMLNAQNFISSPLSTLRIKVHIGRICENRNC